MFAVEHFMSFTERRKSDFRSLQRAEDTCHLQKDAKVIFVLYNVQKITEFLQVFFVSDSKKE